VKKVDSHNSWGMDFSICLPSPSIFRFDEMSVQEKTGVFRLSQLSFRRLVQIVTIYPTKFTVVISEH
jgi:hypothetical protein